MTCVERERQDGVLAAFAETDEADRPHAGLRGEVLPRGEHVLRLLPAERLLPGRVAVPGLALEGEVALVGGKDVVAVRVQHRRPADHRRIAVRVKSMDDDDARRLSGLQRQLAEEGGAVARVEQHLAERRRPGGGVRAARDRPARVVLRRRRVRDGRVAEGAVGAGGEVARLVVAGVPVLRLASRSARPGDIVHSIGNPGASDAAWLYTKGEVRQVSHKKWNASGGGSGGHASFRGVAAASRGACAGASLMVPSLR